MPLVPMTHSEFLIKAIKKHGNKFDYSKAQYIVYDTILFVNCLIHGDFEVKAFNHLHIKSGGCKPCGKISAKNGIMKSQKDFINECSIKHDQKYDYSKVIYTGHKNKIIIICPIHGDFFQIAGDHWRGHQCKGCALIQEGFKKRLTFEQFLEKANKKHRNKYSYYKNGFSAGLITICCPVHGDFNQNRGSHLQGSGCQICVNCKPLTIEDVIARSINSHKNRYVYSLATEITKDRKINIICIKHGLFSQNIGDHMTGHGCPTCGIEENAIKRKYTLQEFIDAANKAHDYKYSYDHAVYTGTAEKLLITCHKHGDFPQTPYNHLQDHGCPVCVHMISKNEIEWLDSLEISQEYRQHTIKINGKRYRVDAYDPITNTVYEFNGDFWHGNPAIYASDKMHPCAHKTYGYLYSRMITKENNLIQAGYKIVSIWESDFKKKNNEAT